MSGDVEVVVERWVDLDRVLAQASTYMLRRLVRDAAGRAIGRAPVDKGKLRQSLNPQSAEYGDDGATAWASFGPKVNQVPYAGYLNAGSYVRSSGKAAPAAPLYRWAKRRFGMGAREAGAIVGAVKAKQRRRGRFVLHYASGPMQGKPTEGWFSPGVVDDMRNLQDLDNAARDGAAFVEKAWNAGRGA